MKKDSLIFSSSNTESASTATSFQIKNNNEQNNIEEDNDPTKFYESIQVKIDQNDELEREIHYWLDQMDVHITCPSSKMHDYFDKIRKNTYWNIQSLIFIGDDLDCSSSQQKQISLTNICADYAQSSHCKNQSLVLERKTQGQLNQHSNCNLINRRRTALKLDGIKTHEIEEDRDENDQD